MSKAKSLYSVIEGTHVPVKIWRKNVPIEDEAIKQLLNLTKLPIVGPHVAAMPDVHVGIGSTVGSVIPTVSAIIPAAVGVDIGCGMAATKTSLRASDLPQTLSRIRSAIESAVPHGRTHSGHKKKDKGAWGSVPEMVGKTWNTQLKSDFANIASKYPIFKESSTAEHLGTLGTGNHFIEMCLDESENVWLMLHSGSRGIGNKIGSHFIELARKDMQKHQLDLPDSNLAYLREGTDCFDDYVMAVGWAQRFARLNREVMMSNVIESLRSSKQLPGFTTELMAVNCHHNYVQKEYHFGKEMFITRKGAVSAKEGEYGIIPGSMGACSFIVRGKGNPDSFHSCSHGAGRKMSRTVAKNTFSLQDHFEATKGVECRKDKDVIDETPAAYKNIGDVINAQSDLVEVVYKLKQVLCVKG